MSDYGTTHAEAHKALWLWLAENPNSEKYYWPGWVQNGGPWPMPRHKCFACIDAWDPGNHCPKCPLNWVTDESTHVARNPCEAPGSLYKKWMDECLCRSNRPTLARQIANMPWHDRTKNEEQTMPEQIDYYSLPLITDFTGLEGAKVWHPEYGAGVVVHDDESSSYPIFIKYNSGKYDHFTRGGRRIDDLLPACRLIFKPVKEHTKEGFVNFPRGGEPLFYFTKEMADCHKPSYATGPFPAKLTWEE